MNELICLPCASKRNPRHISSLRIEPFSCVTLIPDSSNVSISAAVYRHFCAPEKYSDYCNYKDGVKCGMGAVNQKHPADIPAIVIPSRIANDRKLFDENGPDYKDWNWVVWAGISIQIEFGYSSHWKQRSSWTFHFVTEDTGMFGSNVMMKTLKLYQRKRSLVNEPTFYFTN